MSELQPGMAQESGGEFWGAANSPEARVQRPAQSGKIGRAEVRELPRFHIAPDLFYRVQLGRVRRQSFDREPGALPRDVRLHPATLMRAQAVPDEGSS